MSSRQNASHLPHDVRPRPAVLRCLGSTLPIRAELNPKRSRHTSVSGFEYKSAELGSFELLDSSYGSLLGAFRV